MSELKANIAKNIANLRQTHNLTQAELGEKLNYSDKSVSKWERGEITPSIEVLKEISELFDISLDQLTSDPSNETYDKIYTSKKNLANKAVITFLAVSIVWLVATLLFVFNTFIPFSSSWMFFIIAIPCSILILMIFNFIWGFRKYTFIIISCFIWTVLASIFLLVLIYGNVVIWPVFILGIPLQIATILWSQLKPRNKKKQK